MATIPMNFGNWESWPIASATNATNTTINVWGGVDPGLGNSVTVYDYVTGGSNCNLPIYAWYDPNATGIGNIQYHYIYNNAPVLNEEQFKQAQAQLEEETKKREIAEKRAEELLIMCLNEKQREMYLKDGYLEVNTDTATYRIKKGWSHNVEKLKNGKAEFSYCIHPGILVPTCDNMLAQKLMLEHNEQEFLRLANRRALI